MDEYTSSDERSMIFTDDLKTMIHIADENDVPSTLAMTLRFQAQTQDESTGAQPFVFGPLVIRMLHKHNAVDEAISLFNNEKMKGFFEQMSSYVIYMDLLYENQRYEELFRTMTSVTGHVINGQRFPGDCVTLCMAAHLRMNSEQSLKDMKSLLKACTDDNSDIALRAMVYCIRLAMRQNDLQSGLEICHLMEKKYTYNTLSTTNIKALLYARLGQHDDCLRLLREVTSSPVDSGRKADKPNFLFHDILKDIEVIFHELSDERTSDSFKTLQKTLNQNGHVLHKDTNFDEYIFNVIHRRRNTQESYKAKRRQDRKTQSLRNLGEHF